MGNNSVVRVIFWCMRHGFAGHPSVTDLNPVGQEQVKSAVLKYLREVIFDAAYIGGSARTRASAVHGLNILGQGLEIEEDLAFDCHWVDDLPMDEFSIVDAVYELMDVKDSDPVGIGDLVAYSNRVRLLQERFLVKLEQLARNWADEPLLGPPHDPNILVVSHSTVIETGLDPASELACYADIARYEYEVDIKTNKVELVRSELLPCPFNRQYKL